MEYGGVVWSWCGVRVRGTTVGLGHPLQLHVDHKRVVLPKKSVSDCH